MKTKMFEIRDRGTCIVVIAIKTEAEDLYEKAFWQHEGFGDHNIILVRCERQEAHYDPFEWKDSRTMQEAHLYIASHFDVLPNHSVVDVRVLLNEAAKPAETEIWTPEALLLAKVGIPQ